MAGFMGKLRTFIGTGDSFEDERLENDKEDFDGREFYETETPGYGTRARNYGLGEDRQPAGNEEFWENTRAKPRIYQAPTRERENVVYMQNKALERITSQFKIVVIEPSSFEECPKLVDSLKTRKPVIINLERMETDVARKIFDFLSGATYALGGNVQKIANNIFVFLPENVDVTNGDERSSGAFGRDDVNPWKV